MPLLTSCSEPAIAFAPLADEEILYLEFSYTENASVKCESCGFESFYVNYISRKHEKRAELRISKSRKNSKSQRRLAKLGLTLELIFERVLK